MRNPNDHDYDLQHNNDHPRRLTQRSLRVTRPHLID